MKRAKTNGGRSKSGPAKKIGKRKSQGKTAGSPRTDLKNVSGMKSRRASSGAKASTIVRKQTFAGTLHDGSRLATIEEILDPEVFTRTCKEMSINEMKSLSLRRIRETDDFISMRMLGTTEVIDKKRALAEIRKLSPIGMHLLEIERRHIRLQLEHHRRNQL